VSPLLPLLRRPAFSHVARRKEEDGVRDRRERLHRLGARQDAAGEGLRRQDDGQEPRFDSLIFHFSPVFRGRSDPCSWTERESERIHFHKLVR
jgi:hypothetical protein